MKNTIKNKILIIFGALVVLLCIFLLIPKEDKGASTLPKNSQENSTEKPAINEPTTKKVILEVNNIKYETTIPEQISISLFMDKLKNEGKINFKEIINAITIIIIKITVEGENFNLELYSSLYLINPPNPAGIFKSAIFFSREICL